MSSTAPTVTAAGRTVQLDLSSPRAVLPVLATAAAFGVLFWHSASTLALDWWRLPEAGHGLLLGPLALYLMWRSGLIEQSRPQPVLGAVLLTGAVLLRIAAGLAAELFMMRVSLLGAAFALVIYFVGIRQLLSWWLPITLLILSIPLPAVVLNSLALPLQLQASQMGAAMMEWRHVPVMVAGNVIHMPDRALFVTEACSGLRSLTALLALGVLIGGLWLRSPWLRVLLVIAAIPIAVILNAVRIFLTGFFVYFVDPKLGEGLMHYTEGWVMFIVAFGILGALAWVLTRSEMWWIGRRQYA